MDPLFIPKDYEFSSNNPFVAGLGKAYASATANAAGTGAQAAGSVNQLDAPSYEQSFVEISSESHLLHGTFDLTLYDVYGDKFVLDGLEYGDYASPNFEGHMPVGAGGVSNIRTADPAAIGTTSGLQRHPFLRTKQHRGGGASNFTSCFEVSLLQPRLAALPTTYSPPSPPDHAAHPQPRPQGHPRPRHLPPRRRQQRQQHAEELRRPRRLGVRERSVQQ